MAPHYTHKPPQKAGVCGILIKKCNVRWLEQYALPISMLGAMAASIPVTMLMG